MIHRIYLLVFILLCTFHGGQGQVYIDTLSTNIDTLGSKEKGEYQYLMVDSIVVSGDTDTVVKKVVRPVKRQLVFMKKGGPPDTVYSIQLTLGSDSSKVGKEKKNFLEKYPTLTARIVYESSYFKLRTGIYKTRDKARSIEKKLKSDYKKCFIVEEMKKHKKREGEITYHQDKRLDKLLAKHRTFNKDRSTISRYRVQLFSSSDRSKVLDKRAAVQKKYPDKNFYLRHVAPYFKLRVGDYRSIWNAKSAQQKFSNDFPNAFIVEEKLKLGELSEEN